MQFLRNLRTAFKLSQRVDDLEDEWRDVQLDLADRTDKLDRLLRRLTLRTSRSAGETNPEQLDHGTGPALVDPADRKSQLRAEARARGMIR